MRLFLSLLLIALLAMPLASAQGDGSQRFYITDVDKDADPDACDGNTNYAATVEAPAESKAYASQGVIGLSCAFYASYTTEEDHQLSGDYNIEFWVGCTAGAMIELDYRLTINGQDVVNVRPSNVAACGPEQPLVKGGGIHATNDLFIPAGSNIVMRFSFFAGPEPGEGPARNVFMTVGGDTPSGFHAPGFGIPLPLPVIIDAATAVYENLTAPLVEHQFEEPTSDDYVFNFTTTNGFGIVDLAVNGTGFANATLIDGNGTELFNGTLESGLTEYQNFTAGAWQLSLDYSEFNGTLRFEFLDGQTVQNGAEGATEESVPDAEGSADANETVDGIDADGDDQEAPGVPLAVLLIGLVAVALRRRH